MRFSYVASSVRDVRVLHLVGDLDAESAAQVRALLDEALSESGAPVVVDLARVQFLDSAGLTALEDAQRQADERATSFAFAAPPRGVTRLFEITGLEDRFRVHPDLEHALAAQDD